MKMKIIYLAFALLFLGATNMKAQVAIGTKNPNLEPHPSAILDLRQVADKNLGLLLPQVTLTSATVWSPPLAGTEEVEGMMVFNDSPSTEKGLDGKGVYVWVSGSWSRMGAASSSVNEDDYKDAGTATTAGLTWSLSGITCFDVREGNPEPVSSPYTVTVGGGGTITDIVWQIVDTKAVQSSAATTGNPTATLRFKDRAAISALTPAAITVTAFITLTKGNTVYKVSVLKTVKFQNESCCEGAIIVGGAYTGDTIQGGLSGPWYEHAMGAFSSIGDVCWYRSDASSGQTLEIGDAMDACQGEWRTPNIKEIWVLYAALGGKGSPAVDFGNLESPNSNPGSAVALSSTETYWSITKSQPGQYANYQYAYNFKTGNTGVENQPHNKRLVRCVKTL